MSLSIIWIIPARTGKRWECGTKVRPQNLALNGPLFPQIHKAARPYPERTNIQFFLRLWMIAPKQSLFGINPECCWNGNPGGWRGLSREGPASSLLLSADFPRCQTDPRLPNPGLGCSGKRGTDGTSRWRVLGESKPIKAPPNSCKSTFSFPIFFLIIFFFSPLFLVFLGSSTFRAG